MTKNQADLTELTGSGKQVAWAKDIRDGYMERMTRTMDRIMTIDAEKAQVAWGKLVAIINKVAEAKWWIENQYAIDAGLKQLK